MPYTDHPVWSFGPNWNDGVLERLQWKTDVLSSETSHEQRVSRRLTPRRQFEAQYLIQKENRQYLDVLANVYGASEWRVPIFHSVSRITAAAASGTDTLYFDNSYREYTVGGYVLLRDRLNARNWEVVEILEVNSGNLKLISNLEKDWPQGTFVYPTFVGILEAMTLGKQSDQFVTAQATFQTRQSNPHPSDGLALTSYLGVPVWNMRPDDSEPLDIQYTRPIQFNDNDIGIPESFDPTNLGFQTQAYRWSFAGALKQDYLRRLLYYLRGRAQTMWVPTFMEDFSLVANISAGSTIDVSNIGYTDNAARVEGRQDIRIELRNGTAYYRRITGSAEISATVERLSLDVALPGIDMTAVRSISYMALSRLSQDSVEINHSADSDGLTQCVVMWNSPSRFEANATVTGTWPAFDNPGTCDCSFELQDCDVCGGANTMLWVGLPLPTYGSIMTGGVGFRMFEPYIIPVFQGVNSANPGNILWYQAYPAASLEKAEYSLAYEQHTGWGESQIFQGSTDESLMAIKLWNANELRVFYPDGTEAAHTYPTPAPMAFMTSYFAKRDQYIFFAKNADIFGYYGTTNLLARGSRYGGVLQTLEVPAPIFRMAAGGTKLFYLDVSGVIRVYGISTMAFIESFSLPGDFSPGVYDLIADEEDTLYYLGSNRLYRREGSTWNLLDTGMTSPVARFSSLIGAPMMDSGAMFGVGNTGYNSAAYYVPCPPV